MESDNPERKHEDIDWGEHVSKQDTAGKKPTAKYVKISETLRHTIPEDKQCSMFCGGAKCKYEGPENWSENEQAIKGLFSHWITNNILAMARPNTENIKQYDIIGQFKSCGIKSVINLQKPGEHCSCGNPLEDNEFSYRPKDLMDNDIFFYNFGWKDYGVASLQTILDMVKVMQFAVSEGKVAIHCHAGLGRTGVLIACYLAFNNRMDPDEIIHYIRSRRPNSIQTSSQIQCIQEFGQYLIPLRVIFSSVETEAYEVTLSQFLTRQKHVLHGYEARTLKLLPKIIYVACERLLQLAGKHGHPEQTIHDNFQSIKESAKTAFTNQDGQTKGLKHVASESELNEHSKKTETPRGSKLHQHSQPGQMSKHFNRDNGMETDSGFESYESEAVTGNDYDSAFDSDVNSNTVDMTKMADKTVLAVVKAVMTVEFEDEIKVKSLQYQKDLNADESTWDTIRVEPDPYVLSSLLWAWLEHLKEPILQVQDLTILQQHVDEPKKALGRLEKCTKSTVEYLLKAVLRFGRLPEDLEHSVISRLISALTHQNIAQTLNSPDATSDSMSLNSFKRDTDPNRNMLTGYKVPMIFTFFYNLLEEITAEVMKKSGKEKLDTGMMSNRK